MSRRPLDKSVLEHTYRTWERLGTHAAVAAELKISRQTVQQRLKKAKLLFAENSVRRPTRSKKKDLAEEALSSDLLWAAYKTDRSIANRNRIAEFYWSWTAKAVHKFCNYRHLDERDGYFGAAAEALLSSISKFCPDHGLKFTTFFQYRLNGALLDQCRGSDHVSRTTRTRHKARKHAEEVVGTSPEDIKKYLDWDDETYRQSFVPHVNSLQELPAKNRLNGFKNYSEAPVGDSIGRRSRRDFDIDDALREMLRGCTLQELVVMYLLYRSEMTMREVGACVRISESRISQIHANAIAKMREKGWDAIVECVEKVA